MTETLTAPTAASTSIRLSPETLALLRCPACRSTLSIGPTQLCCQNAACGGMFPVVDGVPVLLNEANSLFSARHFVERKSSTYTQQPKLEALATTLIPEIGINLKAAENYRRFTQLLLQGRPRPRVLVVGGGVLGRGLRTLLSVPNIDLVETDITFGPRTVLICDGHDLPFADRGFDAVIIQAVLEHVLDPYRCVEEIHRVLSDGGIVYAETPFMQQVHGGQFDFTRFTYLGHRRLFRNFDQVDAGANCGPGMALAWAYQYFLLSFVTSRHARLLVKAFARLTSFWLKYFDRYLIDKPGALDAASGFYFLGRKTGRVLPDRELLTLYRGSGASLPMRGPALTNA